MLIFLHLPRLGSLCLMVAAWSMRTCLWCRCIRASLWFPVIWQSSVGTILICISSPVDCLLMAFACCLFPPSLNISHFIIDYKSTLLIKAFFNNSTLNWCLYKNGFLTFSFAPLSLSGNFSRPLLSTSCFKLFLWILVLRPLWNGAYLSAFWCSSRTEVRCNGRSFSSLCSVSCFFPEALEWRHKRPWEAEHRTHNY